MVVVVDWGGMVVVVDWVYNGCSGLEVIVVDWNVLVVVDWGWYGGGSVLGVVKWSQRIEDGMVGVVDKG